LVLASSRSIAFMFAVLLSLDNQPLPLFVAHRLNRYQALDLVHIVQHPLVAQPQFPFRHGIGAHRLKAARLLARLEPIRKRGQAPRRLGASPLFRIGSIVAEVNFEAVEDDSPGVGRERSQIGLGARSDLDLEWLRHACPPGRCWSRYVL